MSELESCASQNVGREGTGKDAERTVRLARVELHVARGAHREHRLARALVAKRDEAHAERRLIVVEVQHRKRLQLAAVRRHDAQAAAPLRRAAARRAELLLESGELRREVARWREGRLQAQRGGGLLQRVRAR